MYHIEIANVNRRNDTDPSPVDDRHVPAAISPWHLWGSDVINDVINDVTHQSGPVRQTFTAVKRLYGQCGGHRLIAIDFRYVLISLEVRSASSSKHFLCADYKLNQEQLCTALAYGEFITVAAPFLNFKCYIVQSRLSIRLFMPRSQGSMLSRSLILCISVMAIYISCQQ